MAKFAKEALKRRTQAAAQTLPLDGEPNWVLAWHPTSIEVVTVDGVDRWVYKLRRFKMIKGVNGIRFNGDTSHWQAFLAANGWGLLINSPNQGDLLHYADTYEARRSSFGYDSVMIEKWTDVHQNGGRVRLRTDDEAKEERNRWRVALIDQGIVPAPDEMTIEDTIEDYEASGVKRLMSKDQKPIVVERLTANRATLERMRGAHRTAPAKTTAKGGRRG